VRPKCTAGWPKIIATAAEAAVKGIASLRGVEAACHQPGWGFCGFFEKLRKETITIDCGGVSRAVVM